jgi:hypothetical protein
MKFEFILIGLVIMALMPLNMLFSYLVEKKKWNKGICASSGKPWRLFNQDHRIGRGYTDGEHYFWCHWDFDTKAEETIGIKNYLNSNDATQP